MTDPDWASKVICKIGRAAGVVVNKTPKVKFASAHDLRRSFGERWSQRVLPQVLMELMRHESIETTQKYYVGRHANRTAAALWAADCDHWTKRLRRGRGERFVAAVWCLRCRTM